MKNTHRQDAASTSQPPANGPIADDMPVNPAQRPTASPRSSCRMAELISARLPGTSNAPPTPCSRRATINAVPPGARPHPSDARVNSTNPRTYTRRRP